MKNEERLDYDDVLLKKQKRRKSIEANTKKKKHKVKKSIPKKSIRDFDDYDEYEDY